jgi:hypothetical protein
MATVKSLFESSSALSERYPDIVRYFGEGFAAKKALPKGFTGSFLREEALLFGLSRLQPILRISEEFMFERGASRLFVELHVYTDHYFDSSARFFEVLPPADGEKGSRVAVTDIMEIDELTKSGLVRFLYRDTMASAVADFQAQELESIGGVVTLNSGKRDAVWAAKDE